MTEPYLQRLAAMVECPRCHGKGYLHGTRTTCPDCHGKGRVPLVPGLTKPCPYNADGHGNFQGIRQQGSPYRKCPHCGLLGYGMGAIPLSKAEAVVAMWDFARGKNWQVLRGERETAIIEPKANSAYIKLPGCSEFTWVTLGDALFVASVDGTDAEALAHALNQALEVKP